MCPSDAISLQLREEENFAAPTWVVSQADYSAVIGDYMNATGVGQTPGYGNTACYVPPRGMIGRWASSARLRDVTDGLSNTFAVGETIGALCITQSWGTENFGTTAHPINFMNASLMSTIPTGANPRWDESIGFRSLHVGGAHFLMGDGAVKFVSENIDGANYRGLASRAGSEVIGDF